MKNLAVITLTAIFLTTAINIFADDTNNGSHSISINIPEVALLDLEGGSSISLAPSAPTEAGAAFDFSSATDNSIWVNYSSVVAAGKSRTVTVAITSGTVPTGMLLNVTAGGYAGNGKGNLGTASPAVTLTSSAKNIITGIGSCYTETGASKGHNLAYSLVLDSADDYDGLVQGSTSITVTYTLTDDN